MLAFCISRCIKLANNKSKYRFHLQIHVKVLYLMYYALLGKLKIRKAEEGI